MLQDEEPKISVVSLCWYTTTIYFTLAFCKIIFLIVFVICVKRKVIFVSFLRVRKWHVILVSYRLGPLSSRMWVLKRCADKCSSRLSAEAWHAHRRTTLCPAGLDTAQLITPRLRWDTKHSNLTPYSCLVNRNFYCSSKLFIFLSCLVATRRSWNH